MTQSPEPPAAPASRPSPVGRAFAAIGAVLALGYTAVVPSVVLFASIGSWECLGASCGVGQTALLVGTGAGYLAGLTAVVLLAVLAFRPRRGILVAALVAIVTAALALVLQIWGVATVASGRDAGATAMQLAFTVDQVAQQAVADTTDMSVWSTPGLTGPDVHLGLCPDADDQFVAISSLTFDVESGLTDADRAVITQAITDSTTALMLMPGVGLSTDWTQDGSRWILTATSACQPIPEEG